ncbi:restriction endonuclease subunit S [Streptomyces sp. NPDC056192]|uniref:restriction endonuclease subunit S n=1 Tax=Streptomyces sp. NPDC056192 TaxID=3345743 RepID=UPI0035E279D9
MTETLPSGWTTATIGEICKINPRQFTIPAEEDDLISKVPMAAVEAESGRMDASETIRVSDRKSLTPFEENDVLFAKVTPCMENGKIAVAANLHGGRAVGSTEFFVLRSTGAIEPRLLMYYLLQPELRKAAAQAMTGAVGLRRVPRSYLEAIELPLPPIAEQRRIIEALEDHLSHADEAMKYFKTGTQKISTLSKSVSSRAVSGNLVKFRYLESGEDLRSAALARRALVVPKRRCKPITIGAPFPTAIPANWTVVALDELATAIEYGTSAKTRPRELPDDVPVLRMGNIQQGGLDVTSLKYLPVHHADVAKLTLVDGDLLFNRTNSAELVGKTAVYRADLGPMTFASYLIRCQFVSGVIPEWVSLVINSIYGRQYIAAVSSQQVGQANVNGTKLAAMPIPLPPTQEQEQILSAVDAFKSKADHFTDILSLSSTRGMNLRSSLLTAAFSGKLVRQDPNDEPASVLLGRIKAEKSTHEKLSKTGRAASTHGAPEHTNCIPSGTQEELPL